MYEWGGLKVGIGQAETVQMEYFSAHQDEFCNYMSSMKSAKGWASPFPRDRHHRSGSLMFLPGEEERILGDVRSACRRWTA
ncbi:MAG: hypothetical protein WKH64_01875 [Chloroflexia bacterium]